jgi:hypothetical protein
MNTKPQFSKSFFTLIFLFALSFNTIKAEKPAFVKIISIEDSTTNGTVTFSCYAKANDSLYLSNLDSVFLPNGWTLTINSKPDTGWYSRNACHCAIVGSQ